MTNNILTSKDLASITGISQCTVITWLAGYRFSRFLEDKNSKSLNIKLSQEFIDEWTKFMKLKGYKPKKIKLEMEHILDKEKKCTI